MPRRGLPLLLLSAACAAGCSNDPGPFTEPPAGPAETSALRFQAVDAGTGAALVDPRVTVRWLVRTPITSDASDVREISSTDPYEIAEAVSSDSLVVELRLEAPSYLHLDTALAVARGATAGPLTLRMTRRLERMAAADGGGAPSRAAAAAPAATSPAPTAAGAGSAATSARQEELLRSGLTHIAAGEYAAALDVLEESVKLGIANPVAHVRLAQVQCAVGRVDAGRTTLGRLEGMAAADPKRAPLVQAFAQYGQGLCTREEFLKVKSGIELARVGGKAVRELEAFVKAAGAVSPAPPDLAAAVTDAQARIVEIRERARRGG